MTSDELEAAPNTEWRQMSKWAVAETGWGYIQGLLVEETAKRRLISANNYDHHVDKSQVIAVVDDEEDAYRVKERLEASQRTLHGENEAAHRRHRERVERIKLDYSPASRDVTRFFGG